MKRELIHLSILLLCFSCKPKPVDLGLATPYFPSAEELREGFVYKFYSHRVPENKNDDPSTDIRYRRYQFINPDILELQVYDAAFDLRWYYKYQVNNHQFRIMDSYTLLNGDTIYPKCRRNLATDWANQTAYFEFEFHYNNGYKSSLSSFQSEIKDTIIDEKSYKFISKLDSTTYISDKGETSSTIRNFVEIYEKGIGFVGQISEYEKYTTTYDLIEKMTIPEFEKRSKHNRKRIGYIDPNQTLDDHSDFKLCNSESRINEYYSCKKRGELKGGKGSWWRVLKNKLIPQKLKNESGFLTYRFVINCMGETGRFVVEGADLDYNRKEFNKETVHHLYDIISKEREWQHCHGNYFELDSHAFLTFKLKDGEIIELLP